MTVVGHLTGVRHTIFATLSAAVVSVVPGDMKGESGASDVADGSVLPNGKAFQSRPFKQNPKFHSDLGFFERISDSNSSSLASYR
jgi:hypothetical protein